MDEESKTLVPTESAVELEPHPFNPEDILDLKEAGLAKPAFVPWAVWNEPMKLNYRHLRLIDLAALGRSSHEIAEDLNLSVEHVRRLVRSPIVNAAIHARRDSAFAVALQEKLKPVAELALDRVRKILEDDNAKESTQVEAAKFLLNYFTRSK